MNETHRGQLMPAALALDAVAMALREMYHATAPAVLGPWDEDISGDLATNPGPWGHPSLDANRGWYAPSQGLAVVDKVTIHHTLSQSPHSVASNYVRKWNGEGRGHPTTPYSLWITADGRCLLSVPLEIRPWHDHTGYRNTHLSVGMAGELHKYDPPDVQLRRTAQLCAWAIGSPLLPRVTAVEDITGHMDWIKTECPGWLDKYGRMRWKDRFFDVLRQELAEG